MTPSRAAVLAIGKYPGDPEYLRAEGGGLVPNLSDWIDAGMMAGYERYGGMWASRFAAGLSQAFLWHSDGGAGEFLCGVLAPSRDAVGRPYPLAVFARVPAKLAEGAVHALPLAFGEFLESASELIDEVCATPLGRDAFRDRLLALPTPDADLVVHAGAEYQEWCATIRTDRGWDAIFPEGPSSARAGRALDVALAASSVTHDEHGHGVLGLRVPLGNGGPGAAVLWLDVLGRIGGWLAPLAAFWSAGQSSLVIARGTPQPSLLPDLWAPESSNRDILDLTVPVEDTGEASGPCSARLADEGAESSMRDFLASLTR